MKKIYLIPLLSAGLLMAGCSKEKGFDGEMSDDEGQVLKTALDMSTTSDQILVTRAEQGVDLSNFKINFIKKGETVAAKSYTYSEMPDVVTLKVGTYTATAELGQDLNAEWENPYFKGQSEEFDVEAYKITSFISPIECELMNIKATIAFDETLLAAMSPDSYVEVKVGDNPGLNFTSAEATSGKAGYFKHTNENTLVATFHGKVNGSDIVESKSYEGIAKGRWYKLTFKLHQNSGGDPTGGASGEIVVDASVTTEDVNADVTLEDDEPLDDSDRPNWGGGEDPEPPTPGAAPEIIPVAGGFEFGTAWNVPVDSENLQCKFKVVSHAEGGVQELTCEIVSNMLNASELGQAGLPTFLDLVNAPSADSAFPNYWIALSGDGTAENPGLGFPTNVKGQSEVNFDMSNFMTLMGLWPGEQHTFKLHVKDANGESNKDLILQY